MVLISRAAITSAKGAPLRRILCSFLCGAAAFCVVPTNIQAANIQAPGDIIWVTTGNSIAKYNANGTAINTNFITVPLPGQGYNAYIGGILVSGPILYVATIQDVTWARLYYLLYHPPPYIYVIATYNAAAPGNVTNSNFFAYTWKIVPRGMALSVTNLYVTTQVGSISKIAANGGGSTSFSGPEAPYALAMGAVGGPNGNVLYVTNNSQDSNGYFYISTYTADNGAILHPYFIEIPTGGLYGLALLGNTLYVSVFNGSAPGVYTYNATTGARIQQGPFFSVNEPWGSRLDLRRPTERTQRSMSRAIRILRFTSLMPSRELSCLIRLSWAVLRLISPLSRLTSSRQLDLQREWHGGRRWSPRASLNNWESLCKP